MTKSDRTPALISGERGISYAQLDRRASRAASALRELGLGAGDRLALLMRNDFAYFEAMRAAALLSVVSVPLNWHLTAGELKRILDHSGARAMVAHSDLLSSELLEACGSLKPVCVATPSEVREAYGLPANAPPDGIPLWHDWIRGYAPWTDEPAGPGDTMFYTSGTSGQPKGVSRVAAPPAAIAEVARRSERAWGLGGGGTRALVTGPVYHSAPNAYATMVLRTGGLLVMQPRFDAEELLRLVAAHRISHLYMTPTMFSRLLSLPRRVRNQFDPGSLRHVSHGAAPCPPELKRRMLDWWGDIFVEYYALTETGILTTCDSRQWRAHSGSVGKAVEGIDLRIAATDGSQAAPGKTGEVCVRSSLTPYVSYHQADDETRRMRRGDYMATGDIGYLASDGYLYITGRKTDMVISGGVNIYPAEIEAALAACPGIGDAAVFGVPDPEFGERLVAVLQRDDKANSPDAKAVREFLLQRLARFKVPREIHFRRELPREDTGKIRKPLLKAEYLRRIP